MRRRGITVLVGAVLVALLTYAVGQAPVPYVQLEPGPTYNTLGKDDAGKDVIVITGATSTSSEGQLRFVTIGAQRHLTLLQAIVGWLRDEDAVVPEELIYPPDQTDQQVEQQGAEEFANSQSSAETAAEIQLGYPVKIKIKTIAKGAPADGKLAVGDVVTSIDGTAVTSPDQLVSLIRSKPAGTTLTVGFTRAGVAQTVQAATVSGDDGVPKLGFTPEVVPTAPFTVKVPIQNIGGPSAGLMLTLGIIDKIKPEDLTGGKIIAGTGTIDTSGAVGPIGGVPQKLVAAKNAGATYFLTPTKNCAEAVQNEQPGLTLVKVESLTDALNALADIRAGRQPTRCPGAA